MQFNPTVHKLSNGVTVILDPMDLETVAITIRFDTGSRDETPDIHGITHFCEHMLVKGTKRFPSRKELKDHIENMGGTFNAATSTTSLKLYGRIIAENTNELLTVFADILQNSLFDEKRIEIERGVIMDESRASHGSNSRKFMDFIDRNLFGYSIFDTIGSNKNIKSFTRAQMLDWLHKRLSAKNCVIAISGRIDDTDALLNKLQELFAFLPEHDVPTNHGFQYTPCDKFLHEPSLKNVWINILFPYIRPDTFENMRKTIAESKFQKFLSQELNEVVRQQNGLVYGIGVSGYQIDNNGVRCIDTETSPENIERAVALIAKTAYRVYNDNKITDAILAQYYNRHKLTEADFLESATNRRDVLIGHYCDFGRIYDFKAFCEMDRTITVDEVVAASRGFFNDPMSIITFGPEHNADLRKVWIDNFK